MIIYLLDATCLVIRRPSTCSPCWDDDVLEIVHISTVFSYIGMIERVLKTSLL